YEILLPAQAASLQRGDSQQVEAAFLSGSWFAQGALSEGQNRTHNAQGLGEQDPESLTGVAIARSFRAEPTPVAVFRTPPAASTRVDSSEGERARALEAQA